MIDIDEVSFTYAGAHEPVLRDVSLHIEKGDFVGIIGESGAGKTTLGHIINGIIPHHFKGDYYGAVTVDGLDTIDNPLTDLSQRVGTVSQDIDNQMVSSVVEDEVLYGLENFGVPADEIDARIDQALTDVGIPELRKRELATLSGGQKQKVAIASIIAISPEIILLDEPTGELDPISSRQIFELLRTLNEQGMTVIVIEQKVMLLAEFAKHIVLVDHGSIVLQGTVSETLQQLDVMERYGVNCPRVATLCKRLGQRGLGDGRVVSEVEQATAYVSEILQEHGVDASREASQKADTSSASHTHAGEGAPAVLTFEEVDFSYKEQDVLHDLSFEVQQGEFLAILGPNGTGKSTTVRLANGLLQPDHGKVYVMGLDTAEVPTSQIAHHVGFLFQNPDRQICRSTTREEVAFGMEALGFPEERVRERTEEILELMHLDPDVDPFNLSKGQRQAVALAGLMAVDPEILILDEPTTGFDYAECCEAMRDVKRLNDAGTTVIMICHDMEVVLDYADRCLVMSDGCIVGDGPTREIFQQPQVLAEAKLLPPQISELSQALAPRYPALSGIFGIDEMADAIEAACKAGGARA